MKVIGKATWQSKLYIINYTVAKTAGYKNLLWVAIFTICDTRAM